MSCEIERKFLVKTLPDNLAHIKYEKILQGYLTIKNRDFEVRFRKKGTKYFQTIKRGTGLNREEVEIELSKEQFVTLWPLTEKHRIVKCRYKIPHGQYVIELDIYNDKFKGMIAAEVEFPSEREAGEFQPPDWLGREITEEVSLQNNNLAIHGIDEKIKQKYQLEIQAEKIYRQSGAVPIRENQDHIEALIIQSNNKKKWIFPKGIIAPHLSAQDSAAKEAWEEAGVLGRIGEKIGEYQYDKWEGTCHVVMFLMTEVKELKEWSEDFRKRKWVRINSLKKYVKKDELKPIISKLQKMVK